jgi:hypothetical protein
VIVNSDLDQVPSPASGNEHRARFVIVTEDEFGTKGAVERVQSLFHVNHCPGPWLTINLGNEHR